MHEQVGCDRGEPGGLEVERAFFFVFFIWRREVEVEVSEFQSLFVSLLVFSCPAFSIPMCPLLPQVRDAEHAGGPVLVALLLLLLLLTLLFLIRWRSRSR